MKYMDTNAIINVERVKLLNQPWTKFEKLEEEINTALGNGWELSEIIITPEDRHAYAQLVKIRREENYV